MASPTLCRICGVRRARRECPGLAGPEGNAAQICSICCGTEREVSIACPPDCEYLLEARVNEARHAASQEQDAVPPMVHADVEITADFLRAHEELFTGLTAAMVLAAGSTPDAVDGDLRAALEALIKTYRTLDSGLVYETAAEGRVAADLQRKLDRGVFEIGETRTKGVGLGPYRPVEILAMLVSLARLAARFDNGRPKSRRFLDFLRLKFPQDIPKAEPSGLLIL